MASPAAFTESELISIREELLRDRAQLRKIGGNFVMSYADPKLNAAVLVVEPPASAALRERMVAEYGTRVQVQEGGAGTAAGIPPLTNFNVKGGSYIDDGTWACSAAFNVDTSSYPFGTKAHFFTAGHCFELNSQLENSGGTTVGTVVQRTYRNCQVCPADVEYVNEYYNDLTGAYGQSTNELTNGVRITSVGLGPYTVGTSLCKVGSTSGTSCGTIQQNAVSVCYEAASCFTGMLKVSNDYCHGDSGGAVYAGGAASGIVSGRTWTTGSEPACGGAMGLASTMAGVKSAGYTTNLDVTN